ncbi:helix-turn-helix domain-containing protein [Streptomonospora algeriensis]
MRIGERVRESRAAAGLSQQALADAVGLERSMISKLEKGDRRIDAVELTRLAQPDLASVRVPPRYASAVVAALREALIGPQRAVEMMRGQVSVEELTEEATD